VRRHSLMVKLLILYIGLATIPALVLGVLAISETQDVLWNNTVYSTEQYVEQIARSIDRTFEEVKYFQSIGEESCVYEFLNTEGENYENAKEILGVFDVYTNNGSFGRNINNVYVIGEAGKAISVRYGVKWIDPEGFSLFDWDRMMSYSTDAQITAGNINPNARYSDQQFIYIAMPLYVRPLRDPFGAVLIEVKDEFIAEFCDSVDIAGTGYYTVFNQHGEKLFGHSQKGTEDPNTFFDEILTDEAGSFTMDIGGEDTLVVYDTIPVTGWKMVGQIAVDDLMGDAQNIRKSLGILLVTIIPGAFIMFLLVLRQMIHPLRKLQAVMRQAALGDMTVRFESRLRDEIGVVGHSFNRMIEKLDALAKRDIRRQTSLQKAALDLMQAQINPHFLYNTLDTIMWSANAGDNTQVIETVDALASFYRTTLSSGESWVTVDEEVRMIESYLFIQKARYKGLIDDHIEIEDGIRSQRMLKLTLQPIVENAIYHGLKNRRNPGNLWISGCEQGEYLRFVIRDDGAGIAPDVLEKLCERLENNETSMRVRDGGGFGLENVNARIKLYYGEDCGLNISAVENGGTEVTILIRKEAN